MGEHIASFRAMPNMLMMRPGDGNETAGAYAVAVANRKRPTTMALSRQGMPNMSTTSIEGVKKGAYTVVDCGETPECILIGTGSELQFAVTAGEKLAAEGTKVNVVSMPCWELFEETSAEYKESVFPADVRKRVSVEAGSTQGWMKYTTDSGIAIGVDGWGASAPGPLLYEKY